MNPKPVFIGGCDRSGTTLLGSMLGAHSQCLCVPESQFFMGLLRQKGYPDSEKEACSLLDQIRDDPRFIIWETDLGVFRSRVSQPVELSAQMILFVVAEYGRSHAKPEYDYWIDHTPSNAKYIKTLLDLFPHGKFIHIVRDGRAVAASLLSLLWGPHSIDKAAYYWLRSLSPGLAAEISLGSDRAKRVKFEDLVRRPEKTVTEICEFLGLTYEPMMIEGKGFTPPAFTKQQHSLIGHRPDVERISAWEDSLSAREVEIFESISGDMLTLLAYRPKYTEISRPATTGERISSHMKVYKMFLGNTLQQIKLIRAGKSSKRMVELNRKRRLNE